MHLNIPHILAITALLTTTLATPMYPEGSCEDKPDIACYPIKRSPLPEPAPMFPEGTCGPEEDLACYPDGSNEKRSASDLTAGRPPTITAPKVTIPPLGAPTNGADGGGYLRLRSTPTDPDSEPNDIVIGSKHKRSPEEPTKPEVTEIPSTDVGAWDEEKRRRSLSLDSEGHPILTGDNYPSTDPIVKRERPIDDVDYPEDFARYPDEDKREASPLEKIEIDGDYPKPDDSSYPVKEKTKRMRKLDVGDYQPPDDNGVYGPDK